MRLEDAEYIVCWRSDPDIIANIFSREPLTLEFHLKWFNSPRQNRLDYVICLRDDEKPIGTVNFVDIDLHNLKAEAGKMVGNKSVWGKGLAKEACILWLSYGFKELGLNRIYTRILSHNIASIELDKKLGFKQEGLLRQDYRSATGFQDVIVMGLLKNEAKEMGLYGL
jgi:RimJ/RimL family protein N-acetyltransferase